MQIKIFQPDQRAIDQVIAERARLESLVVALNQEVTDLQAQNLQLLNESRVRKNAA